MRAGPESQTQAERHHWMTGRCYAVLGCWPCSAQLAYGRQYGRSRVHPPCEQCRPVVQTWPGAVVNGWPATLNGEAVSAPLIRATASPMSSDSETLTRGATGAKKAA